MYIYLLFIYMGYSFKYWVKWRENKDICEAVCIQNISRLLLLSPNVLSCLTRA